MRHYPSIEILEDRIAPATIVNPTTVTYQDIDGDNVVIKISKPLFINKTIVESLLTFSSGKNSDGDYISNGIVGNNSTPEWLFSINLAGVTAAQGMDISVTVQPKPGVGNGQADVESIVAATLNADLFSNNIDLGNVTIQGNLGSIFVGDSFTTPALKSLNVNTFGIFNGQLFASSVLGPITKLHTTGDMVGLLHILGSRFASIGTLEIDGALKGNSQGGSGQISFSGTIGNATIGQISGNDGSNSGAILGSGTAASPSAIKSLHVLGGGIVGGDGSGSGRVAVDTIGSLRVDGNITGSGGGNSGYVTAQKIGSTSITGSLTGGDGDQSGNVRGVQSLGTVKIAGSIQGGSGSESGLLFSGVSSASANGIVNQPGITVGGDLQGGTGGFSGVIYGANGTDSTTGAAIATNFQNIVIKGSVIGGAGDNSGFINSNGSISKVSVGDSIIGGTGATSGAITVVNSLDNLTVTHDVHGANSASDTAISQSAYISAKHIGSITIGGSLIAGTKNTGSILDSGAIRANTDIGSINILGDFKGNETNPAIIAAGGSTTLASTATQNIAINKIVIGGNMNRAAILAGYGTASTLTSLYGEEVSVDAQINSVVIGGNLTASSIVAGISTGNDGFFGTSDDSLISASSGDLAKITAKIASVLVKGAIGSSGSSENEAFGIVAQQVVSVDAHGVAVALTAGASNDTNPGVNLGSSTATTATTDNKEIHVLEV